MGRRGLALGVFGLSSLILAGSIAEAYVPTLTPAGRMVRWPAGFRLNLAGNSANSGGMDTGSFRQAVVRGLQRWQQGAQGAIRFDYWQGTNPSVYVPNVEFNGLSSIYFASNTQGSDQRLDRNVLGVTQVWYDTNSGEILEIDIELNDRDFRFTTNPRDTSGFGSPEASGGSRNRVFIENVITHELGHAFGLSHSSQLQSTMLFMESPEQAHLSCDELTGISNLYPTDDYGARGAVSGSVISQSGAGIFGAHVVAISRRRGTALGSAITDGAGQYSIAGLEPGTYFLLAEPFAGGARTLPTYYAGIRPEVCGGGERFSRTFLLGGDDVTPTEIRVPTGGGVAAPAIIARCGGPDRAAVPGSNIQGATIYSGSNGGFGAVDRLDRFGALEYRLDRLRGDVEIHAVSYSLYSPIAPTLSLVDASGRAVASQVLSPAYSGDSGYVNYDAALIARGLPEGTYRLQVDGRALSSFLYPAGPSAIDATPFFVLTGSVNEGTVTFTSSLPANARCRMNESYGAYASPAGDPPRTASRSNQNNGRSGFCGTIQARGEKVGGGPPSAGHGEIAGWFLPWLAMLGMAKSRRPPFFSRLRLPRRTSNLE